MAAEDRERVLQQAMLDAIEGCLPLRFRACTHKRGHWPNVRSWGEPDTPGWQEWREWPVALKPPWPLRANSDSSSKCH